MPTRAYLKAVNVATQAFLRTVSQVVGVRGGRTTRSRSSRRSKAWRTGSASAPTHVHALLADPSTAFVLVAVAPPRRGRRGRSSSPRKLGESDIAGRGARRRTACTRASATASRRPTGRGADTLDAGAALSAALFAQPGRLPPHRRGEEEHVASIGGEGRAARRWCACRSWPTTCTTSTASPPSGATCSLTDLAPPPRPSWRGRRRCARARGRRRWRRSRRWCIPPAVARRQRRARRRSSRSR